MTDTTTNGAPVDPPPANPPIINEKAVLYVATAMAKAHHGPDATETGGYMQLALTHIAAALAMGDCKEPMMVGPETIPEQPVTEAPVGG